jgi:hypothetical protein
LYFLNKVTKNNSYNKINNKKSLNVYKTTGQAKVAEVIESTGE